MRKRFEGQLDFESQPISEVKIDLRSRDELPPLLAGLQYIFKTKEVNEQIYELLEEKLLTGKKATGRYGLSLWEIFVLGSVRLNLDIDYDRLQDMANSHMGIRGILGVHKLTTDWKEQKYYALQTLKDNVGLLDEQVLKEINEVIVKSGHQLKKNERKKVADIDLVLELKTDSYAVESNVHFPTDLWLLWDSIRKCLDVILLLKYLLPVEDWGKIKYWFTKSKKAYRSAANIHRKKGGNYKERLKVSVESYLNISKEISKRVVVTMIKLENTGDIKAAVLLMALKKYHDYLLLLSDQMSRRILEGETIGHEEKLFSIFEPHTEWLSKGKLNRPIELGHNVQITTDQFHFIVDHEVLIKQTDKETTIELGERLASNYGEGYKLLSISFDRGYYSKLGYEFLSKLFELVVMPKPGKKTTKQQGLESEAEFVRKRRKHSAIESNINELEHSGGNKVPDKGLKGFKKYVAWSVLSYNIKRLGKLVKEQNLLETIVIMNPERKRSNKAA